MNDRFRRVAAGRRETVIHPFSAPMKAAKTRWLEKWIDFDEHARHNFFSKSQFISKSENGSSIALNNLNALNPPQHSVESFFTVL